MSKVKFADLIRGEACEVESGIPGLRGFLYTGANGAQVVFWESDDGAVAEEHSHEYDEYCVVVQGTCEETFGGKTYLLHPGEEIMVPAGVPHKGVMSKGYRAIDVFGGQRVRLKSQK